MSPVSKKTVLENVEHVLASGNGTLDFAVAGESKYQTWRGREDADWIIEDAGKVENVEEDRMIIYPETEHFICEIAADSEEFNEGPVRCYCEE